MADWQDPFEEQHVVDGQLPSLCCWTRAVFESRSATKSRGTRPTATARCQLCRVPTRDRIAPTIIDHRAVPAKGGGDSETTLRGIVEIDEVCIRGKERKKHDSKKLEAGRRIVGKMAVVWVEGAWRECRSQAGSDNGCRNAWRTRGGNGQNGLEGLHGRVEFLWEAIGVHS